MRRTFARLGETLSEDVRSWSAADVLAFLKKQKANQDYVEAFAVQKVTGLAIQERECLLVHYMDPKATDQELSDEIMMDALLRTEGWTVKRD